MKVHVEEIPTVTKVYHYIASDGTDFTSQWECERYERSLSFKGEYVIESAITNLHDYYNESNSATLYDIRNEDDWNLLVERVWYNRQNIKNYPGPDQYLVVCDDNGDYGPYYTIYDPEEYLEGILEEAHDYEQKIRYALDIQYIRTLDND